MKKILCAFLLVVSSITCFAIQQSEPDFQISDTVLVSKAEYTTYPKNFFGLKKRKYLKIKIKGDAIEEMIPNRIRIHIVDSNDRIKTQYRSLYRPIIHCKKKNIFLKKEKESYCLYHCLRYPVKAKGHPFGMVYNLEKGTYHLYLEYRDDMGYFKSNTIKLIIN